MDNIEVDYNWSHHIKYLPISIKEDKNEILAMNNEKRFSKVYQNFTKIVDVGK